MRDTDRRDVQHCPKMEGEPCSSRVVATGRIDEEDVRDNRHGTDRGLELRALTECQQAGLVRSAGCP